MVVADLTAPLDRVSHDTVGLTGLRRAGDCTFLVIRLVADILELHTCCWNLVGLPNLMELWLRRRRDFLFSAAAGQ